MLVIKTLITAVILTKCPTSLLNLLILKSDLSLNFVLAGVSVQVQLAVEILNADFQDF